MSIALDPEPHPDPMSRANKKVDLFTTILLMFKIKGDEL